MSHAGKDCGIPPTQEDRSCSENSGERAELLLLAQPESTCQQIRVTGKIGDGITATTSGLSIIGPPNTFCPSSIETIQNEVTKVHSRLARVRDKMHALDIATERAATEREALCYGGDMGNVLSPKLGINQPTTPRTVLDGPIAQLRLVEPRQVDET